MVTDNASNSWADDLSQRIGINEVKALAEAVPTSHLFELIMDSDGVVARNAAWVLTHKSDKEIAALPQEQLIDLAMSTPWTALRRLTMNLILRQPIEKDDIRTDFLDFCLTHMVMLEEPVGVQALCMKMAHRMCSFYPEFLREFNETLNIMHTEHYKPGLKHLVGKLNTPKNSI